MSRHRLYQNLHKNLDDYDAHEEEEEDSAEYAAATTAPPPPAARRSKEPRRWAEDGCAYTLKEL